MQLLSFNPFSYFQSKGVHLNIWVEFSQSSANTSNADQFASNFIYMDDMIILWVIVYRPSLYLSSVYLTKAQKKIIDWTIEG